MRKDIKNRGKLSTKKITQDFSIGTKVSIDIDSSIMKGQPHPRFYGKTGTISEKQGKAYVVNIENGGKTKKVISRPEHLKKVKD